MTAIRCLAIANRGEAALRCLRTVKALRARAGGGPLALALYTDPDRDAPFVRHADHAIELRAPGGPRAAHLDAEGVLSAAQRGGADALWPGWGFLAEDPAFADRVEAAGLRFLGPPGDVMRRLGDKIEAKRLAERLGVPVAPWSGEALVSAEAARKSCEALGGPLLLKAAAGGGGRGIRSVADPAALDALFRSASQEAQGAFGDGRLYLERRIEGARHVEVQIAADAHGRVLALGARECSVQRRHQKLIEEAPPPGLPAALVARLEEAALALARAVAYRGVGTVEFLVGGDVFWFLEVNPRLQVEHGVTEEVTGVDLVEWQLRIAEGGALPDASPPVRGHAIEARLCAEDPEEGFRPAPGRVARFDAPQGPGLRVDAGVVAGSTVPADFDSLIAKLIARGEAREPARARLAAALRDCEIVIAGGATNRGFLLELLESPALRAGAVATDWLEQRQAAAAADADGAPDERRAAALCVAAILAYQGARAAARHNFFAGASQVALDRVPPSSGQAIDLVHGGASYRVQVFAVGAWRYRIELDGALVTAAWSEEGAHAARLVLGGRSFRVLHHADDAGARVEVEGRAAHFAWSGAGEVRSATPAVVVGLHVAPGDCVESGEALGVLEAMKTEVAFHAPVAGRVAALRVRRGEQVAAGQVLLVIEPARDGAAAPAAGPRIRLAAGSDALDRLLPAPDAPAADASQALAAAGAWPAAERRAAVSAAREEIRRLLLGYDQEPGRAERLARFLEAPLPAGLDPAVAADLGALCHELAAFVDVETLFLRAPRGLASGGREPSNLARLRAFVRRMHAEGAGIAESFLALLRRALAHYGVNSLAPGDALERALLRLFATRRTRELRHRMVFALVRRLGALGAAPADAEALRADLGRIAELRGLVSDALADAAIEAQGRLFAREPEAPPRPAAAAGLDLGRLAGFALEPLPARPGVVAFHGRHREVPDDERVFVGVEVADGAAREADLHVPAFERAFYAAANTLRAILLERDPQRRLQWNRIWVSLPVPVYLDLDTADVLTRRLAPATRHLGLEKVLVRVTLLDREDPGAPPRPLEIAIAAPMGTSLEVTWRPPKAEPLRAATALERRVVEARRRRLVYPYEIVRMLTTPGGELPPGRFEEWDLDEAGGALCVAERPWGENRSAIVFGVITTPTDEVPEGLRRVLILSDPTRDMGALAAPECDRIVAALDLAERLGAPVEWAPVSAGARIAMDSGTENLDATARVARRIVRFTAAGGAIHLVVHGVNVGAQSYWNALATMLGHTRGALIMTGEAAMVLTGRAALEASGSVAAEDEVAIGGFERVMGPNGEAQYFARDLAEAWRILYQHHRYSYAPAGERGPRRLASADPVARSICEDPYPTGAGDGFATIGEIFDAAANGERKRPFAMRALMGAVADRDGGHLERWSALAGGETAIVWDCAIGGFPVCLVGIESRPVPRDGYLPPDGPPAWSAGTLFPLSSRKVARALRAASGNRPVVVLANLSGFDGSPESMRKLQLEHGAEIARAVVEFEGPILFLVVSRYHGGAYVVFSKELNPSLRAAAIEGSFASVIGGGPAAAVVFARELRAQALADPRVAAARTAAAGGGAAAREAYEQVLAAVLAERRVAAAEAFDAVHTVERALRVGSLDAIVAPAAVRPWLVAELEQVGKGS